MLTRRIIFLLMAGLAVLIAGCDKKDSDSGGWSSCTDCVFESWVGLFGGTASYTNVNTLSEVSGLDISIEFEETASEYLTAYVTVPNYFSTVISGEWNSAYAISFAGSNASLTATMYSKEGDLRLVGNAKKYHIKVDSVIVDEVISFEVYKQN